VIRDDIRPAAESGQGSKGGRTRKRLLDATAAEVARCGVAGTSIDAIAAAAGLKTGSIISISNRKTAWSRRCSKRGCWRRSRISIRLWLRFRIKPMRPSPIGSSPQWVVHRIRNEKIEIAKLHWSAETPDDHAADWSKAMG
jgi:hypothetical protein